MKKVLILCVLILSNYAFCQNLSVFDIDSSNFPILKAKFLLIDNNGNQIVDFSTSDFEVKEDNNPRKILSVSCPPKNKPVSLSSVLTIDVSGSMSGFGMKIAKEAASLWVNLLTNDTNECAITSFSHTNYLNCDFTTNTNSLINAINALRANGGTSYNAGFIDAPSGGLKIVGRGKYKKILIFLTDGYSYNTSIEKIIEEANKQNCIIYSVVLGMTCPKSLKQISSQTGGLFFENILTVEEALNCYKTILFLAKNLEPCSIEWESDYSCINKMTSTTITNIPYNAKYSSQYRIYKAFTTLQYTPLAIYFKNTILNKSKDTTITVKAINSDFNITKINTSNSNFNIKPDKFYLKNGDSIALTITYTPKDSMYEFSKFDFENNSCPIIFYASGGTNKVNPELKTLKLTHPNGREVFVAGTDTIITWEGIPETDTVVLEVSYDNGIHWNTITNQATGLKYIWNIYPIIESKNCLIRVKQVVESIISTGISPNIKWQNTYGGSLYDVAYSIQETIDGGCIFVGYSSSNDGDVTTNYSSTNDYWIVKLLPNGKIEWQMSLGGSLGDDAYSVKQTIDGSYIVAGISWSYDGDLKGLLNGNRCFIVKLNPSGEIVWKKAYGGYCSEGVTVKEDYDGNYVIAGTSLILGEYHNNYWLMKLNKDGEKIWERFYGGSKDDVLYSIHNTYDNGYILAGATNSNNGDITINKGSYDYWIVKLNSNAEIEWQKTYGGSEMDRAMTIQQTLDGGYIAAGYSYSSDGDINNNKGNADIWVIKLNSNGDLDWQKNYGGYSHDLPKSIKQTFDGGYVIAGYTMSNDGDISINHGNCDSWLFEISTDGFLEWEKTYGGSEHDFFYSIEITKEGSCIAAGSTRSEDGDITQNKGVEDVWIVRFDSNNKFAVQEDVSDTLFSIVLAKATAKDIDMKQCIVDNCKDSIITNFIVNSGLYKVRIDSIYFTGLDANSFSIISGFPKYELNKGESKNCEIHFAPNRIGKHEANIHIVTQSETLIYNIYGEGVKAQIGILSNIIDFGKLYLGTVKDTIQAITIKNISNSTLTILETKHNKPNDYDFSTLSGAAPFTLMPGDTAKMDLRYKPSSVGRTSGVLEFHYHGISSPECVQLIGECLKIEPNISTNSPICEGDDILFYCDTLENVTYHWFGPNGFNSSQQNTMIRNAKPYYSGRYYLYVVTSSGYISDTVAFDIIVDTEQMSPGDSSLIFVGSAKKVNDYIRLTESKQWDGGSLWLKNRFSIKKDFATTFQFRYKDGHNKGLEENSLPGADGFAFVLQNHNYPFLGEKGGAMGYKGITNSMAIEFDLFQNIYDPNGNHIAIQSMGALENQPNHNIKGSNLAMNDDIITIQQDSLYYVKIEYDWDNLIFKVYLDTIENFINPIIELKNFNIADYLQLEDGEYVYIGFTSGTGQAYQEHNILNWTIPCANQLINNVKNDFLYYNNYDFSVYPNPAMDDIFIESNIVDYGYSTISVINSQGIIIKTIVINTNNLGKQTYKISTDGYSNGLYFIKLQTPNNMYVQKILIIK